MRRLLTAAVAVVVLLAGCGGSSDSGASTAAADQDPGFGHVHGLGRNTGDGGVYAATHYGLFRLEPGKDPVRVADRVQDTMGFTIAGPDLFLGSGHSAPRSGGPGNLGMIRSTDRGQTWTALSLEGQVDFHALTATGSTVYGWDSGSGTVLRSEDAGASWQRGATLDVADLSVDPTDPRHVLATGAQGLLESTDRGASFAPAQVQPPVALVFADHPRTRGSPGPSAAGRSSLAGVDPSGTIWTRSGDTWSRSGRLDGGPEAFTAISDTDFLAATETGVFSSADGGRTWTLIASTTST